jgi:hypothetical protein
VTWTRWTTPSLFLRGMPLGAQLLFFGGTFLVFLPTGLLTDVSELGATPVGRLALASAIAGATAVAYIVVARYGAIWMAVLAPFHVWGLAALNRVVEPLGPPLTGDALKARLGIDVGLTVLSLIVGFSLLSTFIRREGSRHGPPARRSRSGGPDPPRPRAGSGAHAGLGRGARVVIAQR